MIKTGAQERNKRLSEMAREAIAQYNADMAAGGEPVYPEWAIDLLWLTKSTSLNNSVKGRVLGPMPVRIVTTQQERDSAWAWQSVRKVMPIQSFGKSQQERDFDKMVRADRAALVLLGACLVLTCLLVGLLDRVPT